MPVIFAAIPFSGHAAACHGLWKANSAPFFAGSFLYIDLA
jgi:hypothetical protein